MGLYIYASGLYPGGSQANLNSVGFDWINNYWCNLMNKKAMNGASNPARPFAIAAMIILCASIAFFFVQFSRIFAKNLFWKFIIRIFGIVTMTLAVLIFTDYHDVMTTASSLFGVFVVIGIIWELYQSDFFLFKIGGLLCVVLLVTNNYIYYTGQWIQYLPFIQKVTFALVLIWITGLNYKLTKKTCLNYIDEYDD